MSKTIIYFDRPFNHKSFIMPRTPEQYNKIREERKTLIMNSALELFANRGYHGTSISDIARKAKISKGLLYNYFSGKEALVVEIMREGFQDLLRVFDPNQDGVLTRDELRYMIVEIFNILKADLQFWRLYFALVTQPIVSRMAMENMMEMAMPIFNILTEHFRDSGYKNPEIEARMLAAFLDGISVNYVFDPENFPLEQVKERLLEVYKLNDTHK